jgi:hypothetical protein
LRHYGDYRASVESVIRCGGDADTVGAITGALAGIASEIPAEWINKICDWPLSTSFLTGLADALERRSSGDMVWLERLFWPLIPVRNLMFLLIVLTHRFRRRLPF